MKNIIISILLIPLLLSSCSKAESADNYSSTEYLSIQQDKYDSYLNKNRDYIILIPDVQNYISFPENNIYLEQIVDWVLKLDALGYKIKAVLQTGDLTNGNSTTEWLVSKRIFSKLYNKIEFIACTGNHDYGLYGSTSDRISQYSSIFRYPEFDTSYINSFIENNYDNSYFKIYINSKPFYIFSIEFAPRDEVLKWVENTASKNNVDFGLLLTHSYLYLTGERYNHTLYNAVQQLWSSYSYPISKTQKINDGEEIWEKLVNKININFVVCGHVCNIPDNVTYLNSRNMANNSVWQMLFNTQLLDKGGDGWVQILEFQDTKIVNIKTYSVLHDKWQTGKTSEYQIIL